MCLSFQAKLVCLEGSLPREAVEDLIKRVAVEKTPKAESLVKHLGPLKAPLPSLNPLLDNWAAAAARSVDTGTAGWELGKELGTGGFAGGLQSWWCQAEGFECFTVWS